jgi:hypothetical protein
MLGYMRLVTSLGRIVVGNVPTHAARVDVDLAMQGLLIAIDDFAAILARPASGSLTDHQGGTR